MSVIQQNILDKLNYMISFLTTRNTQTHAENDTDCACPELKAKLSSKK